MELDKIGIIHKEDVLDSMVIRMPKTYPGYFGTYDRFEEIQEYVNGFENLFLVGRNGMHKYNNQDHSMLTAMVAVDNIVDGIKTKDNIWDVNTEMPKVTLKAHKNWVLSIAWSPCGQYIVSGGKDGMLALWSRGEAAPLRTLRRNLNLHEYQSAALMAEKGVNVPFGLPATTVEEAVAAAATIGDEEVVIKSQILAGGRGLGSINIWYAAQFLPTIVLDLPMPDGAENAAWEPAGFRLVEQFELAPPEAPGLGGPGRRYGRGECV